MRRRRHLLALASAAVLTVVAVAGAAPAIDEYSAGLTGSQKPTEITAGPDGNLWFTEFGGSGAIGRITPGGTITEFTTGLTGSAGPMGIAAGPDGNPVSYTHLDVYKRPITEFTAGLSNDGQPTDITAGPDGALWFTEMKNPGRIGRITASGVITEFTAGLTTNAQPSDIAEGPDGNLWFTEKANPGRIGRITPAGVITEFTTGLTSNAQPGDIAAGPDGNIWFTEQANPGRIGRITPAGVITEFTTGLTTNAQPAGIAAGPDGNLWFTEQANPGRIGRITPAGVITEFTTGLTSNAQPVGVAAEPDGNIWFTEQANPGRIGRITLPPGVSGTAATGVTPEGATLGAVASPRSQATSYVVEYGTTAGYGTQTAATSAGAGAAPVAVGVPVSGLTPRTTYHFRVVATNAAGTTTGPDATFSTPPPAPALGAASADAVDHASAVLSADVTPNDLATTYHFEYGTTAAYGAQTTDGSAGGGPAPVAVHATLGGLTPETTYHFRVVATNASGTTTGADATFTTASAPAPAPPPSGPPAPPSAAPPALGRSVSADVVSGTIRVRLPGSSGYAVLDDVGSLPLGTTIDARDGVLALSTALPGGGAQTGTFWGGTFGVRQDRGTGMTHLMVRRPAGCAVRAAGRVAESFGKKRRRRAPQNDLWGSDSGGRFSTHGANSAATVRGTRWLTVERCDGTLTRVVSGRVLVRDLRTGRRVMLTPGRQYLARFRR